MDGRYTAKSVLPSPSKSPGTGSSVRRPNCCVMTVALKSGARLQDRPVSRRRPIHRNIRLAVAVVVPRDRNIRARAPLTLGGGREARARLQDGPGPGSGAIHGDVCPQVSVEIGRAVARQDTKTNPRHFVAAVLGKPEVTVGTDGDPGAAAAASGCRTSTRSSCPTARGASASGTAAPCTPGEPTRPRTAPPSAPPIVIGSTTSPSRPGRSAARRRGGW